MQIKVFSNSPDQFGAFLVRLILCACVALLFFGRASANVGPDPADSAAQRHNEKPKSSFSEKALWVPTKILQAPVYLLEGVGKALTMVAVNEPGVRRLAGSFYSGGAGLRPVFSYGSRSGLEFGLRFDGTDVLSSEDHITAFAAYSVRDYQDYRVGMDAPRALSSKLGLYIDLRYQFQPRERLFGVGATSSRDFQISYTFEQTVAELGGLYRLTGALTLSPSFSFSKTNIYDGRDPDKLSDLDSAITSPVFGLNREDLRNSEVWNIGAELTLDWRNHPGRPTSGGVERVRFTYNKSLNDRDSVQYTAFDAEVVQFIHIYRGRTLLFQARVLTTDGSNSDLSIPFYLRNWLGGARTLRAFSTRRFLDNDAVILSAAYRWPVWDVIDAFLFWDGGRVYSSLTRDFTFKDFERWEHSAGFGFRAWSDNGELIRISVAFSNEETRFHLQAGVDW